MKSIRICKVIVLIILAVLVAGALAANRWIRHDVRKNISIAQQKYQGSAEDALISFFLDESNPYNTRTHVAIWTLGMLKSEKALPVLQGYYKDDPKGITCRGNHDRMLCQRELHKAITQIEGRSRYSTADLNR